MARRRERMRLEDGFKLDLNLLVRQGFLWSGSGLYALVGWRGPHYCEMTALGHLKLCLSSATRGSTLLHLGELTQTIDLVAAPRHFGGVQWYFVCPVLGRRASVLWMPPGASRFACRQAWGGQVAYRSQFESWPHRAISRAWKIRDRLGGEEFVADFGDFLPSKPKGMHWRTYNAQIDRLKAYEMKCDSYEKQLVSRFNKA
jgi:hypothetical protein